MIPPDPPNLKSDSEISIKLPRLVFANDYHDFRYYENILRMDFGLIGIVVEEIGYYDGQYIGLAHLDTPEHKNLARELEIHFREEE